MTTLTPATLTTDNLLGAANNSPQDSPSTIEVELLRLDGGTQPRAALNFLTIEEYAQAMLGGVQFPPVTVFYDGTDYWLADGFHRVRAAEQAGMATIPADVRQGTRRDAVLFSVGANASHGMRRTNKDKRRAVETLLRDAEWGDWPNTKIATVCAVAESFVRKMKDELGLSSHNAKIVERNGTTYTMNTANIGAKLTPEARQVVAQTAVAEDPRQVRMLEQMAPEDQMEVAVKLAVGEATTVVQARRQLRQESIPAVALPVGKYRTLVIDPPWPVEKIIRDVRPRQAEMDYPVMSLEEIEALPIPDLMDPAGCHVYLWTTHKFVPAGLELFAKWGIRYQCLMTWVKNVGFTPFSWIYSTEHVLFGRTGNLDLLQMGLRLDFAAPINGHSRKPDVFYERVCQASPEPRLEMFARQARDGFSVWGNQV